MPTQEDRIADLERKVATLEQTSVTRTDFNNLVRQQGRNTLDINEKLTMLLGLVTVEQENVKTIKGAVIDLKERVSDNSSEIASLEEKLDKRFVSLEERLDKRFVSLETRSNEHTVLLNEHTTVLNEHTALLRQILARLPEKP